MEKTRKFWKFPCPPKPQEDDVTTIDVTLLTPTSGAGAALGDQTSTRVTINNDVGELNPFHWLAEAWMNTRKVILFFKQERSFFSCKS